MIDIHIVNLNNLTKLNSNLVKSLSYINFSSESNDVILKIHLDNDSIESVNHFLLLFSNYLNLKYFKIIEIDD
jgi:hypothetical protein